MPPPPPPWSDDPTAGDGGPLHGGARAPADVPWTFREAWRLVACLPPAALDAEARCYLVGLIAGTLGRVAQQAAAQGHAATMPALEDDHIGGKS